MRNFFDRLTQKMTAFMYGRYGYDALNKFLTVAALVCMILSPFIRLFYPIAMILLIALIFRTYSRNISARQKELDAYLKIKYRCSQRIHRTKNKYLNRKTHKYYNCPKCRAALRVPKGKGKIEITCPMCGHKFIKKT